MLCVSSGPCFRPARLNRNHALNLNLNTIYPMALFGVEAPLTALLGACKPSILSRCAAADPSIKRTFCSNNKWIWVKGSITAAACCW